MLIWFQNICALLTFAGFGYLLWVLWGRAARHIGVSRLTLLGSIALFGWLIG
jgi:hypothetical protein